MASSRSQKGGDFRPVRLLPPTLSTDQGSYSEYLSAYRLYVGALDALRTEFWQKAKSPGSRHEFVQTTRWHAVSKDGKVLQATSQEEPPVPDFAPKDGFVHGVSSTGVKPVRITASPPAKASGRTPLDDQQQKERKLRRSAARRRQRRNRRLRELQVANKFASQVGKLEAANLNLARMAKKAGSTVAPSVAKDGRVVQRPQKSKSPRQGAAKGSSGPKGPPGPPPSGTGGGAPQGASSPAPAKPAAAGRQPNRKERRRAIYGPPSQGGSGVVAQELFQEPVVETAAKPAPFSFGDTSSDDEPPPRVPTPVPSPPPVPAPFSFDVDSSSDEEKPVPRIFPATLPYNRVVEVAHLSGSPVSRRSWVEATSATRAEAADFLAEGVRWSPGLAESRAIRDEEAQDASQPGTSE